MVLIGSAGCLPANQKESNFSDVANCLAASLISQPTPLVSLHLLFSSFPLSLYLLIFSLPSPYSSPYHHPPLLLLTIPLLFSYSLSPYSSPTYHLLTLLLLIVPLLLSYSPLGWSYFKEKKCYTFYAVPNCFWTPVPKFHVSMLPGPLTVTQNSAKYKKTFFKPATGGNVFFDLFKI